MRTFKDKEKKDWGVSITVGSLKRVKELLKIDLIEGASDKKEDNIFIKISTDPIMLVDIIYVLCKPEADKLGISDEQFGGLMNGDSVEEATAVFIEELIDFFPTARRPMLRTMTEKIKHLESKGIEYVTNCLYNPAIEANYQASLEKVMEEKTL